jgi:uncharacterized protein YdhG (YjbR/CyaY superfamily)
MAKTDFKSVDEYLAAQTEAARPVLERVRGIIRKAVPGVEEVISYQLPTFKLNGTYLIYLAGFKQHYSLYPVTEGLLEALKDEIDPYLAGKGTMRFPLSEPVPARLIERIAKTRAEESTKKAAEKVAVKRR